MILPAAHFLFGVVSGVANEGQIRLNYILSLVLPILV